MARRALSRLLPAALLLARASARIHTLTITNDPRFVFSVEAFGFLEGGKVALAVRSLSPQPAGAQHTLGFVMYPTDNQATVDANVRYLESSGICALDAAPEGALVMNMSEPALWPFFSTEGDITGGGEFALLFTHCQPRGSTGGGLGAGAASAAGGAPVSVSFVLEATFVNPGNNYLSAGDMPLPAVFGAMAVLFAAAAALWVRWLRAHASDVHRVHHLMTLLVCVKAIQLLCESLMYEYIATTGHNSFWNGERRREARGLRARRCGACALPRALRYRTLTAHAPPPPRPSALCRSHVLHLLDPQDGHHVPRRRARCHGLVHHAALPHGAREARARRGARAAGAQRAQRARVFWRDCGR